MRGGQGALDACSATAAVPGWDATQNVQKVTYHAGVPGMTNKVTVFTPDIQGLESGPGPDKASIAWCSKSVGNRLSSMMSFGKNPSGQTKMVDLTKYDPSIDTLPGESDQVFSIKNCDGGTEWKLTTAKGTPLYEYLLFWCRNDRGKRSKAQGLVCGQELDAAAHDETEY